MIMSIDTNETFDNKVLRKLRTDESFLHLVKSVCQMLIAITFSEYTEYTAFIDYENVLAHNRGPTTVIMQLIRHSFE